jgi:hypothetical protein
MQRAVQAQIDRPVGTRGTSHPPLPRLHPRCQQGETVWVPVDRSLETLASGRPLLTRSIRKRDAHIRISGVDGLR